MNIAPCNDCTEIILLLESLKIPHRSIDNEQLTLSQRVRFALERQRESGRHEGFEEARAYYGGHTRRTPQ